MPRIMVFCILLLLFGCAQRSTVTVAAAADTAAAFQNRCYAVAPGMSGTQADDPEFGVHKKQTADFLLSLGYCLADDEDKATALVLLSYGEERWGQSYQEEPRVRVGIGIASGSGRDGSSFGGGAGFTQPHGGASLSVTRRIVLDAVPSGAVDPAAADAGGPGAPGSLWSVTLTATGRSGILHAAFPNMLEAARSYIGRDSHGPVTVTLEDGDIW